MVQIAVKKVVHLGCLVEDDSSVDDVSMLLVELGEGAPQAVGLANGLQEYSYGLEIPGHGPYQCCIHDKSWTLRIKILWFNALKGLNAVQHNVLQPHFLFQFKHCGPSIGKFAALQCNESCIIHAFYHRYRS